MLVPKYGEKGIIGQAFRKSAIETPGDLINAYGWYRIIKSKRTYYMLISGATVS